MNYRLILIRHGITKWNIQKRYCGFKDISLSPQGKKEAKKLSEELKDVRVDRIYSSNMERAIQTARIIFKKRPVYIDKGLKEINFGIFEGLTYKQILQKYPKVYKKWLKRPFSATIPKGERLTTFKKRVLASIQRIVSDNYASYAIICHGGTISILLNSLLKKKNFWRYIPKSASMSIVEYKNGKGKLRLFNKTAR